MRNIDLTLEERQELRAVFDNRLLMSAIRKVLASEADYWRGMGRSEALTDEPSVARLVNYAAREKETMQIEGVLSDGAGIQKHNREE